MAKPEVEEPARNLESQQGMLRFYDAKKGFGFIIRPGAPDLFLHSSALGTIDPRELTDGRTVAYQVEKGRKGEQAAGVRLTSAPRVGGGARPAPRPGARAAAAAPAPAPAAAARAPAGGRNRRLARAAPARSADRRRCACQQVWASGRRRGRLGRRRSVSGSTSPVGLLRVGDGADHDDGGDDGDDDGAGPRAAA